MVEVTNTAKEELEKLAKKAIEDISKINNDVESAMFGDKRIPELITYMFTKGAMLGLEWNELINYFKDVKEIEWSNKLPIDSDVKKVLVVIKGNANMTLDECWSTVEKYFSNVESLEQYVLDEDLDKTYVEYLLMR